MLFFYKGEGEGVQLLSPFLLASAQTSTLAMLKKLYTISLSLFETEIKNKEINNTHAAASLFFPSFYFLYTLYYFLYMLLDAICYKKSKRLLFASNLIRAVRSGRKEEKSSASSFVRMDIRGRLNRIITILSESPEIYWFSCASTRREREKEKERARVDFFPRTL